MTDPHNAKKLLLISLDGLSAEQFQYLSTEFGFLKAFTKAGITQFEGGVLTSAQALWGEILSGQHWWETGCVGYAFPKGSINDLEIGSQSSYRFRSIFIDNYVNFAINVPLLEPGNGKHLWLSDGSFNQETVSPKELLQNEPFRSYRPRPFASPAYFLGNPIKGAEACLQSERHRLACAIELAKRTDWQIGIVRLSVFDQLFHLLGSNFLYDEALTIRPAVNAFIDFAGKCIEEIILSSANATTCIVSTYSHSECTKRANLNLLLSQLGYCTLTDPRQVKRDLDLRHRSTLAVSTKMESSILPTALVTLTNRFQAESSIAASPVHGAIYLNTKDRFQDGIVEVREKESLKKQIASALAKILNDSGVRNTSLELNPQDSQSTQAPDLMICANGLDFHDAYDAPAVDTFSHPLTCHTSNGFVCLDEPSQQTFNTLALNKLLVGRLT